MPLTPTAVVREQLRAIRRCAVELAETEDDQEICDLIDAMREAANDIEEAKNKANVDP